MLIERKINLRLVKRFTKQNKLKSNAETYLVKFLFEFLFLNRPNEHFFLIFLFPGLKIADNFFAKGFEIDVEAFVVALWFEIDIEAFVVAWLFEIDVQAFVAESDIQGFVFSPLLIYLGGWDCLQ